MLISTSKLVNNSNGNIIVGKSDGLHFKKLVIRIIAFEKLE